MKLVLIRHGITSWNLEKRIQGQIDQPLCEIGKKRLESYRLSDELVELPWYCSPLRRARQSIEILGIEQYEIEPLLIEMNWGEWEGQILKPLRKILGDVMRDNEARGIDFCPPSGESPRQVQQRLKTWLIQLSRKKSDAAAVVHKGVIKSMYAMAEGWDMQGESPVQFNWDAAHIFEFDRAGSLLPGYHSIPLIME